MLCFILVLHNQKIPKLRLIGHEEVRLYNRGYIEGAKLEPMPFEIFHGLDFRVIALESRLRGSLTEIGLKKAFFVYPQVGKNIIPL